MNANDLFKDKKTLVIDEELLYKCVGRFICTDDKNTEILEDLTMETDDVETILYTSYVLGSMTGQMQMAHSLIQNASQKEQRDEPSSMIYG